MIQHSRTALRSLLIGLVGLALLVIGSAPAAAVPVVGRGVGYLHTDGRSWIGSYRLADDSLAFCLEAGKATPVGSDPALVDGRTLGRFDDRDSARLAYISREWASSADPATAAAAQLSTWRIGGLNGHDPSYYASRAGADAALVLNRSDEMLATADKEASSGVDAVVSITLPSSGRASIRAELIPVRISGDRTAVEPSAYRGTATLSGAVFDDGQASRSIGNGVDVPIVISGPETTVRVRVDVSFESLPFGSEFTVASPTSNVQSLLVARPANAKAAASADRTGASPRPFHPLVETTTSLQSAEPGARVSDLLAVRAEEGTDALESWGVTESDGVYRPVEVVVESSLLGPFSAPIAPADRAPEDAPVLCTVETAVTGPGEYRTPDCELGAPGWYVWVERSLPDRTPEDEGGLRVIPWVSSFGVASEITRAVTLEAPAAPAASAPHAELAQTGAALPAVALIAGAAAAAAGAGLLIRSRLRGRRR